MPDCFDVDITPFSARTDFRRQNLMSMYVRFRRQNLMFMYVRFRRQKSIPALKEF